MRLILQLFLCYASALCLTRFSVPESSPVGHRIGWISGKREEQSTSPNYFVVFPDEQTSKFLKVDEKSGEISTIAPLDYEKRSKFDIVAVRVEEGQETIDIVVEVEDENDNAPIFVDPHVNLEISEFAQLGTSFSLPTVIDGDGPKFDVHRFVILQGNVNNVFKLTPRKVNEQLQADLVVNGRLDREFRDKYELLIEAQDGGKPAKTGQLRCSIEIVDANDNAPVFSRSRYTASVSSNISIGSHIITVQATDGDIGENARLRYEIKKTSAPSNSHFAISQTGVITTTARLLPGSTHDVIIVASDYGSPSLSSSAVVTISVMGGALASPPLDIIWLVESNSAHLMENATLGSIVARVSISEPYRKTKLRLTGSTALCPQQTDQSHVYLLLLCGILDRETVTEYNLKFLLEDEKDGHLVIEHPQLMTIGDINDNAPQWHSPQIHISLNRTQGGYRTLTAKDPDLGQNGWIRYSILDTELVSIDKETGRIFVPNTIDCNQGSEIKFRVRAEDGGSPALSTDLQVVADLLDSESKPPQFEKALWQVEIPEDTPVGTCLVKVAANNSQCGNSKRIRYSMQNKDEHLSIDTMSGTVCIQKMFDFEKEQAYQTTVVATNSNSETSTSLVSIRLKDVNDNWPIFYPNEYHLTVREGPKPAEPLLVLSASDLDSGKLGEVTYHILSESTSFSINSITGEVFAKKDLTHGRFHLIVSSKDGGGQSAENPANIHITVIDKDTKTPEFSRSKYEIRTTEDILPGIAIGSVAAISEGRIKYSIYSGDPDHNFSIDEDTGKIYVTRYLDADVHDTVLLNVQATMDGGQTNQTQVMIYIEDHNDNSPIFGSSLLEISVREDTPLNEPFYVVHASDKDKKKNGQVKYSILTSHPGSSIEIDPLTGQLSTSSAFDYESVRNYKVRIKASDLGIPPKSSNMTLFVHIVDVNDNSPIFEKSSWFMEVLENSPPKTIVGKVSASDKDSQENGVISYRITNGSEYFGIDEKLGAIYTKRSLDRETISHVDVTIVAEDKGSPTRSSSVPVRITVLDVNDNPPSCLSITPIVVPANSPASTAIGTIVATDPDKGLNGSVLYRAQLQSNLFVVKSNGDVYLRRPLNSSDEHHQRLSVIVSDQGTPRKSTVCHVAVRVARGSSEIVLQEPVQRFVSIPESCSPGCRLISFNATGVQMWQIQSSDISNHFSIRDGVLSLVSTPNHRPPYSIVIILSDKNDRQKSIQMRILAAGEMLNKEETIRISDTNSIGSKVGRLGEKAPDGTFFYRFSNSSESNCPLELDQTGGLLYLADGIRGFNSDSNYSCFFEKLNTTSGNVDEMRIDLDIAHSKSDKPQFDTRHLTVHVREDTPTGSIITTVNATALDDSTTPISYRFTSQIDTFAIDQFTGDITLIDGLHWHVRSVYQLVVEVFTSGAGSTLLVTVEVEDVNDHSPFIVSQPAILLPSAYRKEDIIHRLVAIDLDSNPNISYSISSDTSKIFKINGSSGELSILLGSSEELPDPLTLTVRADDVADPTKFDEQKILVKASNDSKKHWHFFELQKQVVEIEPNGAKDTVIAQFKSSETGVKLRLIPSSQFFEIRDFQVIQTTVNVPAQKYKFTVVAEKNEKEDATDWSVLEINVAPSFQEPPKISSTSCGVVTIEENTFYKTFKRIMATGTTKDSKFRFQGKTDKFTIDPTTGDISVGSLDRESAQEHLLVVILTDGARNDSCTVRVIVADVNDNKPQFDVNTPDEITINESSQVGDVLFRFSASDMDIGLNGKLSFEIVEDPAKVLDVTPETGALVIRRDSDKESWNLKIRVFDYGIPSLSNERTIRILNQNVKKSQEIEEVEFLRQSYVSSIDESLPRGQFVAKLETSGSTPITYSIVEGNVDSAFSIDADGVVRTNLELDKEIVDQYNLKVIGLGKGVGEMITTRVDVRVNNINDNIPSFPVTKPRRVSEALKVGSYVASVSARDVDQLVPLQYSIEDGSKFSIDRFTGVIHLTEPLDYEDQKEHTVRLKVTDGSFESSSNLTVFVSDVNDNAPMFPKSFYKIRVAPMTYSAGVPFAKIEATDLDSSESGKISYSVEGSSIFRISPEDGSLSMKVLPPSGERYLITVTAMDNGVPSLSTSVPVEIVIEDTEKVLEEMKPAFTRPEFRFEVLENSKVGLQIGNLSGDEFSEFQYRISDAEASKMFSIDSFGRLFVSGNIDREVKDHYNFQVEIDDDKMSKTQYLKCHVTILDENDNSPQFTSPISHISLRDSMTHGQTIGQLMASDPDSVDNGRVTYRLLSGNDLNIVTLNSETGSVQFNEWNDAILEEFPNATWTILIEARDHGHPYRSTLGQLIISLKMSTWSGSAPFFVLPAYEVHVLEDTPTGTVIQKVRASNRLGIQTKGLLYSLKDHQGKLGINVKTGEIVLKSHLDWESEPLISMYVSVSDGNGRSAVVPLKIVVEPVDEFAPVFTKESYTLQIPISTAVGESVGQMQAVDEDGGIHGIVKYAITDRQNTVLIEEDTGIIRIRKSLAARRNLTIEQITVVAYSSPAKRSKTTVYLEIGPFDVQPSLPKLLLHSRTVQIAAASLILLLALLIVVICICMCRSKRDIQKSEPPMSTSYSDDSKTERRLRIKPTLQKQVYSVQTGEIRTITGDVITGDLKTNSMTSSVSTSSDALRMIRGSSRSQMDSGIDPDNVSINSSITDYLVSLGVNANPIHPRIRPNTTYDSLMNEYIYARVEDVLPPGPISLTTPNQHSLLRQPLSTSSSVASRRQPIVAPSFEPLTEIFSEIVEMRKNDASRKEYVQVEI